MHPTEQKLRDAAHARAQAESLARIEAKLDRLVAALLESPDPAPAAAPTPPVATPGSAAQP